MADNLPIPSHPPLTRREALVFCRVAAAYESDRYLGRISATMLHRQLRRSSVLYSLAGVRVILEHLAFRGIIRRWDGGGRTPRRYALNALGARV